MMKHDRKNKKKSKAGKGPGYEYWGTRDSKECRDPGKDTKVLTHRRERRKSKTLDELILDDRAMQL